MGLKKYEIITVGSDKRVRALRSWQVQDRYVNIGDVGGIVYDEKTLSQDGACWLFRGNFNFPGARIGGDSVVDVGEEAPDVNLPTPDLNILGSSAVVGSKVRFSVTSTAADAITLIASDFEQGGLNYSKGANWETWKAPSARRIRLKTPIFMGGKSVTLKVDVPGYLVQAFAMDRDGIGISVTNSTETGEGVTLTVPAGQYFTLTLAKNPSADIVPTDATAAQIKFTGAYKNTLNIIDSRVSINPVTDTANRLSVILGGTYPYTTGREFPPCNTVGSTVNLTRDAATSRSIYIVADVENSNVSVNATSGNAVLIGVYSNVKNLVYSLSGATMSVAGKNSIQAYNCDNIVVNATNFPGLAAMQTAGVPIKFYGCNVPNGIFYHHAQIANTYRDINFDLATKDLGKSVPGVAYTLVSSETEGMYRIYNTVANLLGFLVGSYDSISSIGLLVSTATSYGTTIYKDAYVSGKFDFAGTNVFGNAKKHDTQDVSGCKIVNTGETAVSMKGNIRVEGNATLTNCSIIGSGYFGGKAVASGLLIEGSAFMSDNASFTKTAGVGVIGNLKMKDNGKVVLGDVMGLGVLSVTENAMLQPTNLFLQEADLIMSGNALVTAGLNVSGILRLKDNAKVAVGAMTVKGDITVCGSYSQTTTRRWFGKRVIDNENAPEYDNNVKTQYDF